MKTAFQKIAHFNELIGNSRSMPTSQQLRVQFEMIREEFCELEQALSDFEAMQRGDYCAEELGGIGYNPLTEMRDGIADVLVTTYGLAHRLGVDADADLEAVYLSNMSKFVSGTMTDAADASCEVSDRLGISVATAETAPALWAITSSSDQVGRDGKQYPKGKLLKPAAYRGPIFHPL